MTESKRQRQVSETIKRHISLFFQEEGSYFYGTKVLITVTDVKMTPDFEVAKVYLSIFNTENKEEPIQGLYDNYSRIRQVMGNRLKSQMRRIPRFAFFVDDTLDEIYRVEAMFERLHAENQMGKSEEENEEEINGEN